MSYATNGSEVILPNETLARDLSRPLSGLAFKNNGRPPQRRKNSSRASSRASDRAYPIIVHCHLCWDWVWQRPQQFISRLSSRHEILYVETLCPDPQLSSPLARFYTPENCPNVTVLRLQFPTSCWSDGRFVDRERRRLVKEFLAGPGAGRFVDAVQWFYDPMAVTAFAGQMDEVLTVYDCMDELSKFRAAPPELKLRELELLETADVVFTGGRALWEAKRAHNPNCHFYGCGVDVAHFGKARAADTRIPDEAVAWSRPVLGYFGVVDERIDYELLAQLADANPDWSVVMVGPTLKVEAAQFPHRPNLHWLGRRDYADLPAYCKAFDVCLMPFALNEATEFINPTKALEYMAAGRPIVSSAVPDVVRNFGSVVRVAKTRDEFISFCRQAATEPDRAAVERG